MNTVIPIPRYTYNDYQQWEGDWELIGGYPFAMSPSPISKHQLLASAFEYELVKGLKKNRKDCLCKLYHETDWIISEENVVRPDICIVCGPVGLNDHIRIPPVLVVEIFSPATRMKDRNTKFRLYEETGVKFYLMADPDLKKVEVFELIDNQYKEMPDKTAFQLTKNCLIEINSDELFIDL